LTSPISRYDTRGVSASPLINCDLNISNGLRSEEIGEGEGERERERERERGGERERDR
jgi:hypothetical protein